MFKLILAIAAAFVGVSSDPLDIFWNNPESPVSGWGGPAVQFLTPGEAECAQGLFYDAEDDSVSYVDRNGHKDFVLEFDTGDFYDEYIGVENLAFIYPQRNNTAMYVIGAGNNIISAENIAIIENIVPVTTIPVTTDTGYEICKGHADKNGHLFLTLNSKADKKNKGGRLYKFISQKATLVKQYTGDVMGFAWSQDYKILYLIKDSGKTIVSYDYDLSKQDISNEQVVFNLPVGPNKFRKEDKITGIETDNKANCLWIVVDNCGVLVQLDHGKMKQVIKMPLKWLTGMTFGGKDNSGIMISTAKKESPIVGGNILYVSGINSTGMGDVKVVW